MLASNGIRSFAHRLKDEERRPRFTLVGELTGVDLGAGPVCLRVGNDGPTDEFEAFVVAVQGATRAAAPWHVKWRHERRQRL